MIDSVNQEALATWLRERIELYHTPDLVCIGRRDSMGKILGVVGFESYNGASVMMHVAGEGHWLSKDFLGAMFHYPFSICKVNVVIAPVASTNTKALRLNEKVGFTREHAIEDGHPDGDLVIMTMRKTQCKFLHFGDKYGQEYTEGTSSA